MTIIAPYRRKDTAVGRWFTAGRDRAWPKAELSLRLRHCSGPIESLPHHLNSSPAYRSPIAFRCTRSISLPAASPAALKSP